MAAADSAEIILFRLEPGSAAADVDPLLTAIDIAHGRGQLLHVELNLQRRAHESPAEATSRLAAMVRHLTSAYPLDGLHIGDVDARLDSGAGLDAIAEALLVKPYLTVSWLDDGRRTAAGLRPFADMCIDSLTVPLRRASAQGVVRLDLSAILDSNAAGRRLALDSTATSRTDADGRARFVLDAVPDTMRLDVDGHRLALETRFWKPPFAYVVGADTQVTRGAPWVELRALPPDTTSRAAFEFLARTSPQARGFLNGGEAKVYGTGVFFDSIGLAAGPNRIRAEAVWPDGRLAVYERQLVHRPRQPRPALPLWLDEGSVEPAYDLELLSSDVVRLSFRGSLGQQAVARVRPGKVEVPFTRTDGDDASTYAADLALSCLEPGREYEVEIRLSSAGGEHLRHRLASKIAVRFPHDFPLMITSREENYLSYSLGRVRLGGPYLAEYGKDVILEANGRFGPRWRIRLGPNRVGYLHERYVDELPEGSPRPRYFLTNVSASPSDSADVIYIPRPEPVPYSVHPDPDGGRILIRLYGVQTASTWLSHRAGLRYVDRITWRQADPETYELAVNLTTPAIWGYDVAVEGGSLVMSLPYGPDLSEADEQQPLRGLAVAIEAGHGGGNTGAIGLSGLLERDVNLATALVLGDLCRTAGAEVYQLREARHGVAYLAIRDSVAARGADVFLSVHANAAGGGFLRASGTSTYYHNPFWKPLAARIYDRLLEMEFGEFGVVGSFNYRPIRMSSRPAALVEQAFMTHAEDEELLASEAGRQAIAERVLAGLVDWVQLMRSQAAPTSTPEPGAGAP